MKRMITASQGRLLYGALREAVIIPNMVMKYLVQLAYNGTRAFQDKILGVQKKVAQAINFKNGKIATYLVPLFMSYCIYRFRIYNGTNF